MTDREPNRLLRQARGRMTQRELADLVRAEIYAATGKESVITAKSISDWECGLYTWPPAHVRRALCRVLHKADPADLGFFNSRRVSEPRASSAASLLDLMAGQMPTAGSNTLRVPNGRSFSGVDVEAHVRDAVSSGEGWLMVDPRPDAVLNRPDRRSLVVVVDDRHQSYILDGRRFVNRVGGRIGPQPVSSASAVDDLTVGIIWAVTNTDVALLADDGQISTVQAALASDDGHLSDALLTEVPTLSPVASQWLRSWFCTRRVTDNPVQTSGQPCFWAREASTEDAVSWLLWRHRFEYLRRTSRWLAGVRRDFHVSEADISNSPLYERVLLLLAAALMEAFGIEVALSSESEPEEAATALADESMISNWLGGWSVCCAGTRTSRWCRSVQCDVAEQEHELSAITGQCSKRRLEAIADHLEVSWSWFQLRCSELAIGGVDDVAHPRSRLLSTRGLNTAIRYVARTTDS